jgi:alpha-amylase
MSSRKVGNDPQRPIISRTSASPARSSSGSARGGNLIVITSNSGSSSYAQVCLNTQRANGRWTNVYGNGATVTSDGNGQACVNFVNGEPIVLLASSGSATTAATPTTFIQSTIRQACPTAVSVSFTEKIATVPGETIKIAGNTAQLGNWNAGSAPALSASQYTSSNPVWNITLKMTPGQAIQYKFVKVSSSGTSSWESDPNRAYTVPVCQATASVSNTWR